MRVKKRRKKISENMYVYGLLPSPSILYYDDPFLFLVGASTFDNWFNLFQTK